jgi:hypothetical protein
MASVIKDTSRVVGWSIALALTAVFVSLGVRRVDAHKPVTSKYDYNRDVFPLFRENCGRCHVKGGAAPMSLMTYEEAVPWAESIRDELTSGRMPPWPMDPRSPAVNGMHPISAHDVDAIVTWAAGGTPRDWSGDLDKALPQVTLVKQWKLGRPDLIVSMDREHTLAPNVVDETKDFSIPSGIKEATWVRAADLLPGTTGIVRDAIISVENGPTLALWQPGSDALAAPSGAGFRLAPGATLHLQIHYKKPYTQEQDALSDRSSIGLYFSDPPASGRELQSVSASRKEASGESDGVRILTVMLPAAGRIYALRPMLDRAYSSVDIVSITPSGRQVLLLKLRGPRPQWFRRYWLQEATELPGGTAIEARFTPLADYSDEMRASAGRFPLEVVVDYVSQQHD